MKNTLCILGAALLLAACATEQPMTDQQSQDRAACRRVDAPIGSNLVRKADCAPTQNAATPAETKKN